MHLASGTVASSLTPMALTAISPCVEVCRAAALASHSAAGLVTSARKVAGKDAAKLAEVARLLRSSEALARSAIATLTGMAALARTTPPPSVSGPVKAAPSARCNAATPVVEPRGSASGEAAQHPSGSSLAARRRKKKRGPADEDLPRAEQPRTMDVDTAVAAPSRSPPAPPAAPLATSPAPTALGSSTDSLPVCSLNNNLVMRILPQNETAPAHGDWADWANRVDWSKFGSG